jgi:hypothetical protein
MIKNAYKRCYLKGAGAEAVIPDHGIRPAPVMACSWWIGAVGPRGNLGCTDQLPRIGPVTYWQKQLRKVLPDSLRSRISGVYGGRVESHGRIRAVN